MTGIGTLNESALHEALKYHVAEPGDLFEVPVDGFVVDILRDDSFIEIQTGNFGHMARKLDTLLDRHDVMLVHPIATRTRLHRADRPPRMSPLRRTIYHVFDELVRIPTLIDHPGLTLRVLLITEHKQQEHDPALRRGRGGWRTVGRSLDQILEEVDFATAADLAALLPEGLGSQFTTSDLAAEAKISRKLAQRVAYCLRLLGEIDEVDRDRSGVHYVRAETAES